MTRRALPRRTLLAAALAVTGCQAIIGVSGLEVTGGTGGGGSTTCDEAHGCASGEVCFLMDRACMTCGATPPVGACPGPLMDACSSCDSSTCVVSCDAVGACAATLSLDGKGTPLRVECGDQCNDLTITSLGTGPIEVVCQGGCNGLHLNCSADGACALTCNGSGCAGAQVSCGSNACTVACNGGPANVEQTCSSSCSCTRTGC